MARALTLLAPRRLAFVELAAAPSGPGEVRLRSVLSAIDPGAELSLYRGTQFVRSAPLGDDLVGAVEEIGQGVDGLAPGDVVHARAPHGEEAVVRAEGATRLPPGVSPLSALFIGAGRIALRAVHAAEIKLGDHVAVVGLGAIGLLTAQMARRSGAATVHAIDPAADRRALALELGADTAHDPLTAEPSTGVALKRALGGRGVDAAIETSGSDAGLHDAIACAHLGARVVAAGHYEGGAPRLRLGEEWVHNRLTLHPAAGRPDRRRLVADLISSGALATDRLPVLTFAFADAAEAYRRLDERPTDAVTLVLAY